jgi:hypothetical protein
MPTRKRVSAQWEGISVSTRWGWGPSASAKMSADAHEPVMKQTGSLYPREYV